MMISPYMQVIVFSPLSFPFHAARSVDKPTTAREDGIHENATLLAFADNVLYVLRTYMYLPFPLRIRHETDMTT